MPRQARLDVPGALHYIMVRGINKATIFDDDEDKARFLERLGQNVLEGKCSWLVTFQRPRSKSPEEISRITIAISTTAFHPYFVEFPCLFLLREIFFYGFIKKSFDSVDPPTTETCLPSILSLPSAYN